MKTSTFEKQEDDSLLIICNDVVDHPDHAPALAEYTERLKEGKIEMTKCEMVNSGESQLEIVVTPKRKPIERPSTQPVPPPKEEKSSHKGR